MPGFIVLVGGGRAGLSTYWIEGDECEIVTIDSLRDRTGVKIDVVTDAQGYWKGIPCEHNDACAIPLFLCRCLLQASEANTSWQDLVAGNVVPANGTSMPVHLSSEGILVLLKQS